LGSSLGSKSLRSSCPLSSSLSVFSRTHKLNDTTHSWWISALFAFNAGILDSSDPQGGIVADSKGAYAILLTGSDEVSSTTPELFVYRARDADRGRFRLTAATIDSRHPVRILRSHALHSFWSPRAGVRYEGL
jgi:hypothetical protein